MDTSTAIADPYNTVDPEFDVPPERTAVLDDLGDAQRAAADPRYIAGLVAALGCIDSHRYRVRPAAMTIGFNVIDTWNGDDWSHHRSRDAATAQARTWNRGNVAAQFAALDAQIAAQ